jgi:hypothetical protein
MLRIYNVFLRLCNDVLSSLFAVHTFLSLLRKSTYICALSTNIVFSCSEHHLQRAQCKLNNNATRYRLKISANMSDILVFRES